MSTLRMALSALVAAAVLAPSPAHAQSVRAGRGGAVTTTRLGGSPSSYDRVRSVPVATPRDHRPGIADHFGRSGYGKRAGRAYARAGSTIYVPYATTTFIADRGAYRDDEVLEALQEVRDAALDAREAALDAREAALDARATSTKSGQAPSGGKVLTWKPGGITTADAESRPASRSRTVIFQGPVKPAADAALRREPATRVRLVVPSLPLYAPEVPWWATDTCSPVWTLRQQQRQQDRRRFPWGLGWLYRYGRDVEVERGTVSPPSFYMRSPLLTGLYRRPDCPPDGVAATCAEVTVVGDDDAAIAFEVPLPQLEATTADALRDAIRAGIADGETMVLRTTDGEEFDLMPGAVREIDAGGCRPE